jgi:hypothetical protein
MSGFGAVISGLLQVHPTDSTTERLHAIVEHVDKLISTVEEIQSREGVDLERIGQEISESSGSPSLGFEKNGKLMREFLGYQYQCITFDI